MEKAEDDDDRTPISAAEIYDKLYSNKFIESVSMNVLADMKESMAYKQIRDRIIHQFLNLAANNLNDVVELKKKQIESATIGYFAEILCTDLSKVVKKKLNNEYRPVFKHKVKKIIKCRPVIESKKELSETLSLKRGNIDEQKGSVSNKKVSKPRKNRKYQVKRRKQLFGSLGSISRGYAQNLQDICNNVKKTHTGTNSFELAEFTYNHISNSSDSNYISSDLTENASNNLEADIHDVNKKKISKAEKSQAFTLENQRLLSNEFENYMENLVIKSEPVSEVESELSFEIYSDDSVSSVHTSDLSSFDDRISISSEDEMGNNKRKLISFQEAKRLYLDDKLSSTGQAKKQGTQDKKNLHCVQSLDSKCLLQAEKLGHLELVTPKVLPQRIRRPNSKYSSENIISSSQDD